MTTRPETLPSEPELTLHRDDAPLVERAARAAPAPGTPAASSGSWSAEVQALRAVAVLLVVGYHLWPGRISGGYVGVDVFFVISGFLISGHILRDLQRRRFSLRTFYLRRARRLLPASLLVLLVVALGVLAFEPRTRWVASAQQLLAGVGYAQNWVLAGSEVDYLSPEQAPTAVQHFWSLAVEEQFYLVWPVLLALTSWALLRRAPRSPRLRRAGLAALMGSIALASFGYGVWLTGEEPTQAYFYSTTRVWEFAAGALLALLLPTVTRFPVARGLLSWAGLLAIGGAALVYTDRTPFPGYAALLPVMGSLAFLAAGRCDWRWSPGSLVRLRPTQFVGDVSYSLYLWHWPLIVLLPAALDQTRLTQTQRVLVLLLSLLLAWLSLTLVENRFRAQPAAHARPTFIWPFWPVVAALTVAITVLAGTTWYRVEAGITKADETAARAIAEQTPCFGAAALRDPTCTPPLGPGVVVPDPAGIHQELRTSPLWTNCLAPLNTTEVLTCSFGDPAAARHVVLFGDSHAMQWVAALEPILARQGWRLTTLLRSACSPNQAAMRRRPLSEFEACRQWATTAIGQIEADPSVDVVITSSLDGKRFEPVGGFDSYWTGVGGYQQTWARLARGGRQVVVIRDTPSPLPDTRTADCVAEHGAAQKCGRARDTATRGSEWRLGRPPAMLQAALMAGDPAVRLIDLTDALCIGERCPAVIGNVLVWADDNHMTPTYARTLAPLLEARLSAALAR